MNTGESEIDQLRRFNNQKAEALEKCHSECDDWRSRALKAEAELERLKSPTSPTAPTEVMSTSYWREESWKHQAACGEMRAWITETTDSSCACKVCKDWKSKRAHALSADCGKGWVSPEEAQILRASRQTLAETEQRVRVELNGVRAHLNLAVEALEKIAHEPHLPTDVSDYGCSHLANQTLTKLES